MLERDVQPVAKHIVQHTEQFFICEEFSVNFSKKPEADQPLANSF